MATMKSFVVELSRAVAELTTRLRELDVVIYSNEVENKQSKSPLGDVTFI
jgi:hypothetical protein